MPPEGSVIQDAHHQYVLPIWRPAAGDEQLISPGPSGNPKLQEPAEVPSGKPEASWLGLSETQTSTGPTDCPPTSPLSNETENVSELGETKPYESSLTRTVPLGEIPVAALGITGTFGAGAGAAGRGIEGTGTARTGAGRLGTTVGAGGAVGAGGGADAAGGVGAAGGAVDGGGVEPPVWVPPPGGLVAGGGVDPPVWVPPPDGVLAGGGGHAAVVALNVRGSERLPTPS
jgi:hypothetical protein